MIACLNALAPFLHCLSCLQCFLLQVVLSILSCHCLSCPQCTSMLSQSCSSAITPSTPALAADPNVSFMLDPLKLLFSLMAQILLSKWLVLSTPLQGLTPPKKDKTHLINQGPAPPQKPHPGPSNWKPKGLLLNRY